MFCPLNKRRKLLDAYQCSSGVTEGLVAPLGPSTALQLIVMRNRRSEKMSFR